MMCADTSSLHGGRDLPAGRRAFCRKGGAWSEEDLWDSSGQFSLGGTVVFRKQQVKTGETQQTLSNSFRTLARPSCVCQRDCRAQPEASGDAGNEGRVDHPSVHLFIYSPAALGKAGGMAGMKPGIQHPEPGSKARSTHFISLNLNFLACK